MGFPGTQDSELPGPTWPWRTKGPAGHTGAAWDVTPAFPRVDSVVN